MVFMLIHTYYYKGKEFYMYDLYDKVKDWVEKYDGVIKNLQIKR